MSLGAEKIMASTTQKDFTCAFAHAISCSVEFVVTAIFRFQLYRLSSVVRGSHTFYRITRNRQTLQLKARTRLVRAFNFSTL